MAKYVLKNEDEENEGAAMIGMVLLVVCIAFVLTPGIILTSFLNLFIDFTLGQLWGCSVVGTLLFGAYLYFYTEGGLSLKRFLIGVGICAGIMILVTLFIPENLFATTVKEMFPIFFEK